MLERDLKEIALRLIPGVGADNNIIVEPLAGGGNNRIFKIVTPGGNYALKYYFRHKDDKQDRLESEYMFTSFVWNHGIRYVAEPIAKDRASSVGIYRFIEGHKYLPGDIGDKEMGQTLNFIRELNMHKSDAAYLPYAAEACFSIEDHLKLVDYRIGRLKAIEVGDDTDEEALRFVNNELASRWFALRESIISKANLRGISVTEKILPGDSVLSPSDFGFHNAIVGSDGVVRFIDFEYAGWDDPAKTVGDFFSQVAVPVPMTYFDKFVETILGSVYNAEKTRFRIRLLLPLYRIKWCCIVLNHFLRVDRERKVFAAQDAMDKKHEQLEKARKLLSVIS